jgi:hypothetical protein
VPSALTIAEPILPPSPGYEPEINNLFPSGDHAAQQLDEPVSRNTCLPSWLAVYTVPAPSGLSQATCPFTPSEVVPAESKKAPAGFGAAVTCRLEPRNPATGSVLDCPTALQEDAELHAIPDKAADPAGLGVRTRSQPTADALADTDPTANPTSTKANNGNRRFTRDTRGIRTPFGAPLPRSETLVVLY